VSFFRPKPPATPPASQQKLQLAYSPVTLLEQQLDDGTDESFHRYFFALYHCLPGENADLDELRKSLSVAEPSKSVAVGKHFVLWGKPAFKVVSSYYLALSTQGEPENFREYAARRYEAILQKHTKSQSISIDLSEGQLCADETLDFYACLALSNGQIAHRRGA
jgi:hypothetical protein